MKSLHFNGFYRVKRSRALYEVAFPAVSRGGAVKRAVLDKSAYALPPYCMSAPHKPAFGNPAAHFRLRKERNLEIHYRFGILDRVEFLLAVLFD